MIREEFEKLIVSLINEKANAVTTGIQVDQLQSSYRLPWKPDFGIKLEVVKVDRTCLNCLGFIFFFLHFFNISPRILLYIGCDLNLRLL